MANIEAQLAAREGNAKWFVGVCGALLTAIGTVLTVLKPLKTYDSIVYPLLPIGVLVACLLSFLGSLMSFSLSVYYRANPGRMNSLYKTGTILFITGGVALTALPLLLTALPVSSVIDVSVPTLSVVPEDAIRFPITITSTHRRNYAVTLQVVDPQAGVVLAFPSDGVEPPASSRQVVLSPSSATLVALAKIDDGEPPTRVLGRVVVAESDGTLVRDKVFEISVTPVVRLITYDVIVRARASTPVTFFATANFSGPAEVEVYTAQPITTQFVGAATRAASRAPIALLRGQPVAISLLLGGVPIDEMRATVVVRNRHGLLATSEFRVTGPKS